VVLDTNVLVGYYLSRNPHSANARVFRLWRDQRKIQLIVSEEIVAEYLEVLPRLLVAESRIKRLAERLRRRETVTHVNLGPRPAASRDPDDNLMLATAIAGRAKLLISNDRDLLELPEAQRRKFKFEIVTPSEFLARLKE
jgi:putative PIN family toxin of toxin-antitoxin system